MSSTKERLNKIVEWTGLTANAFAEKIGMYPQRLGNYLKKGREPDLEALNMILTTFPEIDARWLLLGEGYMNEAEKKAANVLQEFEENKKKYETVSPIQPTFAIKTRLREILARNNYDLDTFSRESNISKRSLHSQINGTSAVTVELIRAFTVRFPVYPYHWILTGDKEAEKASDTTRAVLELLQTANKEIAKLNKEIGKLEAQLEQLKK